MLPLPQLRLLMSVLRLELRQSPLETLALGRPAVQQPAHGVGVETPEAPFEDRGLLQAAGASFGMRELSSGSCSDRQRRAR